MFVTTYPALFSKSLLFLRIFEFSLQAFQCFQKKAFCSATKLSLQFNSEHCSEGQCHIILCLYALFFGSTIESVLYM